MAWHRDAVRCGACCAAVDAVDAVVVQMARLIPHLSNGMVVLSERSNDPDLDAVLSGAVTFVPLERDAVR